MKKFFLYTLTLAAAIGVSSCNNGEDMIFDNSAAERLDIAKSEYHDLLCADGGRWVMEYFANADEAGYSYVMTFSKDGSVTMASNSDVTGGSFKQETSLWDIITDDGVVLSFNTYNTLFHLFADPVSSGTGHEGDYEFIFLGTNDDKSVIELKGKKRSLPIVMRRLAADTNVEDFCNAFALQNSSMFSVNLNYAVLHHAPTGEDFALTDGCYGVASVYPIGGDAVTQTEVGNFIITAEGIRFMRPLRVSRKDNPNDSISVQNFVLLPDGTLRCNDENDHESTISGEALSIIYGYKTVKWRFDSKNMDMGGVFKTNYEAIATGCKGYNSGSLLNIDLRWDNDENSYVLAIVARFRRGASNQTKTLNYRYELTAVDASTITLTYKGTSDEGLDYIAHIPAIETLVNYLSGKQLHLSATNMLAPSRIKLATDEADYVMLDANSN